MPGETFQTLKSKATQQAKQSGMSQSSAENYGSAMATQAAIQGNAGADFLGSNTNQIVDTVNEIKNNLNFDSYAGQGGPAGMTFTEANEFTNIPINAGQAILTQLSNENIQQQIAKRREVEKQVKQAGGVFNPKTGVVEYPQKTKLFEGIGGLSLDDIIDKAPSLLLKGIAGGAKGLQLLFDKVFKPEAKDFSDPNFLAVLDAAFKSGKLNEESWKETYGDLLDDVYGGQGIGSLDQATGATSLDSESLFDLAMEEATANVEPGSSVQQITDPASFYKETGMPATSGDLVNLASLAVTPEMQGTNPELVKMIFDARAQLDSMGKNPFTGNPQGGGGQGIMAASSAFASPASQYGTFIGQPGPFIGNFVDQDGDGVDDRFQSGPGQPSSIPINMKEDPPPSGFISLVPTTTGITPFNVNQFYASLPQYTQQGIMNPNLMSYYQNLGLFPGMNV